MRTSVREFILHRFNIDDWFIYLTFVSKIVDLGFEAHFIRSWRCVIAFSAPYPYNRALGSIFDFYN